MRLWSESHNKRLPYSIFRCTGARNNRPKCHRMATALDYANNVYLAVHLNPSSNILAYNQPFVLRGFDTVSDEGPVGSLQDVKLLKVPKDTWEDVGQDILASLRGDENVVNVQVQEQKMRSKRDEF